MMNYAPSIRPLSFDDRLRGTLVSDTPFRSSFTIPTVPAMAATTQTPTYRPSVSRIDGDSSVPQINPLRDTQQIDALAPAASHSTYTQAFTDILERSVNALQQAKDSERDMVNGMGDVLTASVDRARAGLYVSIASATISRVAQGVSSLANMSV